MPAREGQSFMPFVFHIGMPKTGTSSIQRALLHNEDLLRASGFNYCKSGREFASHWTLWKTESDGSRENFTKLLEEIDADPDQLHIVSSERGFLHPAILKNFNGETSEEFRQQVKIICYIRRPDAYFEAIYKQRVKNGWRVGTPMEFFEQNANRFYRPIRVLNAYAQVFGKEALTVIPFERRHLFKGDVVQDFFLRSGIPYSDEIERVPENNPTLSLEFSQMIGLVSRSSQIRTPLVIDNIVKIAPSEALKTHDVYDNQARQTIIDHYSGVLDNLRTGYYQDPSMNFDYSDLDVPKGEDNATSDSENNTRLTRAFEITLQAIDRVRLWELSVVRNNAEDQSHAATIQSVSATKDSD